MKLDDQHITADELLGALKRDEREEKKVTYGSVPGVRDVIVAYIDRVIEPLTNDLGLDDMGGLIVSAELATVLETGIKLGLIIAASRAEAEIEDKAPPSIH
jgi:hypothetical protein